MKLRNNQVAIYRRVGEYTYDDDYKYFLPGESKYLRKNTRNLKYWNGNNWEEEEIEFVGIFDYEYISDETSSPAFYFHIVCNVNGEKIILKQSNTSGSCTPYWTQDYIYDEVLYN